MEIYYFNNGFPIRFFNRFKGEILRCSNDFSKGSPGQFDKNTYLVNKVFNNKDWTDKFLTENISIFSQQRGFGLLFCLTSLFPKYMFGNNDFNLFELFKSNFSESSEYIDIIDVKNLMTFRIIESDLDIELNAINSVDGFLVDFDGLKNSLFQSLYKYSFVTFSKCIEFQLEIVEYSSNNFPSSSRAFPFNFNPDKLLAETKNNISIHNRNKTSKQNIKSAEYLKNLRSAAKLTDLLELISLLEEIVAYSRPNRALQITFKSLTDNITVAHNVSNNKYNKVLRNFFVMLLPLFKPELNLYDDREAITELQKYILKKSLNL